MRWVTVVITMLCISHLQAQKVYATGGFVPSFTFSKILNHTKDSSSFDALKKDLTIIDFFGTWCVPCIKALPHLAEVQKKYANSLQVILVSIEEEESLKKFINARTGFSFPVAVDENHHITNLFHPPAYPYTLILNRDGKVLATLTDAKELTDRAIEIWLKGVETKQPDVIKTTITTTVTPLKKSTNSAVQLSQDFLYAAKTGTSLESLQLSLSQLDYAGLKNMLQTDNEKKAFWINVYNGFSNALLKKNPGYYKNRNKFFSSKRVAIAGMKLSLDEIEHDFLRRTKIKWSLGYLSKPFPSKRAKDLRVDELDYRLHFALNCGAKSCPPIAYYSPEQLDTQLEAATKNYLNSEVDYKIGESTIYLPAILSWFRADFGGKKGMKDLLRKHGILPGTEDPRINFKKYDWTLELNNYKTD